MMEIPILLLEKWNLLSEFVEEICIDRDKSHGKEHMEKVAYSSLIIFNDMYGEVNTNNLQLAQDIITVAWLHDICDHKYDEDIEIQYKLNNFIYEQSNNPILIKNIIERISYSKEDKALKLNQPLDWLYILGEYGCNIRNIVSDADKLEALGKLGLERCIEYAKYDFQKKNNIPISEEILRNKVIDHANDKLLRLKENFIRTTTGKKLAIPLHEELVEELRNIFNYNLINNFK